MHSTSNSVTGRGAEVGTITVSGGSSVISGYSNSDSTINPCVTISPYDHPARRFSVFDEAPVREINTEEIEEAVNTSRENKEDIKYVTSMVTVLNSEVARLNEVLNTIVDLLADLYEEERIGRGGGLDGIKSFIESIAVREGVR